MCKSVGAICEAAFTTTWDILYVVVLCDKGEELDSAAKSCIKHYMQLHMQTVVSIIPIKYNMLGANGSVFYTAYIFTVTVIKILQKTNEKHHTPPDFEKLWQAEKSSKTETETVPLSASKSNHFRFGRSKASKG